MKAGSLIPTRRILRVFDRNAEIMKQIYGAYRDSIDPSLSFEKFFGMYVNPELMEIDITLFHFKGQRAGLNIAFYYSTIVNGKKSFIARSATGLIPSLQGKGLYNIFDLYRKFIRFFLLHPFTPIWVAAYVINPFVFRDLCTLIPRVFPAPEKQTPGAAERVLDFVAESGNHPRDPEHPLSLQVPIQVHFTEALKRRIFASNNLYVKWFLEQNPNFLNKYGLLVVVPVTASNVRGTISNFMEGRTNWVKKIASAEAGNIINLVRNIFRKRIF